MSTSKNIKILLTGGGTGGHVFPAIAIADAIKQLQPEAEFMFVGAQGKMEMERVPQAGYAIEGLPVAGFQRGFSLRSLQRNLSFPFKLFSSLWKARQILRMFQPDVVVGTGGYASGPVMRMAQQMGIPTVIQEQNSLPGVTNRLLAQKATLICVAYDHMDQFFPKEKIQWLGNPVRDSLLNLDEKRAEALAHFGLDPQKQTVYLTGGSLGARTLNQATEQAFDVLKDIAGVQVLWQCGRIYAEQMEQSKTAKLEQVQLLPFVDRMDLAYAAADVVIARSGALTISELCAAGKATILVPSPNVAEDHQTKNAQALTEKEAAWMVADADAPKDLWTTSLELLNNKEKQLQLQTNIKKLGKPNAAHAIAKAVLASIK
ncbi:MAG: undecaprenyldiphospho-muramoylpentapeptide beta-N-acetylglucosaminyltransferase [Saprospiraceae bacterium]